MPAPSSCRKVAFWVLVPGPVGSSSEIGALLYREVERATEIHRVAKEDLETTAHSLYRERRIADENDPQVRDKERTLRNARMVLLLALQRYNSFVSLGIVPEKLEDKAVLAQAGQ